MERIIVWGFFGVIAGALFLAKGGTASELIGGAIAGGLIAAFVGFIFELANDKKKD